MSIRFLSILFLLIVAGSRLSAQPTYSNINLFMIADEGKQKLSAGQFDKAIDIFNSYKLLIKKPVGPLDEYAKKAGEIKKIVESANRKFDSGYYGEALLEFKKYRKVISDLGESVIIPSIEAKIDVCMKKIRDSLGSIIAEKDREIARKDRQILGFEYIFKGDDVLRKAKNESAFELAKDLYMKARELKSGHPDVDKESENRIALCDKIIDLMKLFRKANYTQQGAILDQYKAIDNFKNAVFEKEISARIDSIPTPSATITIKEIEETLKKYADECDLEKLLTYVERLPESYSNKTTIKTGIESLILQLKDIENFNITGDPEQQIKYAKGGFDILLEDKIIILMPVIGQNLTNCIRDKYFAYLVARAKDIDDKKLDLKNAKIYAIEAHKQAINDPQKQAANSLLKSLNIKIGCSVIKADLRTKLTAIDLSLRACRLEDAKELFENISIEGMGCESLIQDEIELIKETTTRYEQYAGAKISLGKIDSLATKLLIMNDCQAAKIEFERLPKLSGCNNAEIEKIYKDGISQCLECERRKCYTTNVTIAQSYEDIKQYKSAKVSYQAALNCANEAQRSSLIDKIFEVDKKIAEITHTPIKPIKPVPNLTFTKNHIPELTAGLYFLKPSIKTGSETKILTSQTLNFDIGLNVNVLKRKITPLTGLMVGLHYNKNAFTTVNTDSKDTESFDFDILNLSLGTKMPVHIHQKKKAREYIRFEANALFPFKVKYHNYFNDYAYDSGISFFKKTEFTSMAAFGGTVGGGHEFQKGKARLGIEAFVKFNFNLLALNPSDAGVRSPSSISSFLLGYGLKTTFRIGK